MNMKKLLLFLLTCLLLFGCESDTLYVEGTVIDKELIQDNNSYDAYVYLDNNRKYKVIKSDYNLLEKDQNVKFKVRQHSMLVLKFYYLEDIKKENEDGQTKY